MKIFNNRIVLSLTLITLLIAGRSSAETLTADNLLKQYQLEKFEGSTLLRSVDAGFQEVSLSRENKVKGRLIRIMYLVPTASSGLEIADNYSESLKKLGFSVVEESRATSMYMLKTCDDTSRFCGLSLPDISSLDYSNTRKLTAERHGENPGYVKLLVSGPAERPINMKAKQGDPTKIELGSYFALLELVIPKSLTNKMVENTDTIALALREKGKISLYGIYFDFDKADIKPESSPVIEAIAGALKSDPTLRVRVEGHTDNLGTKEYNQQLSEKRAQAVVKELETKHQVDSNRLLAVGKGLEEPVDTNETEEGRSKNRRVQLVKL